MSHLSLLKSIVSTISSLLESREFLESHRFPHHFVRNRILSMSQVVMFLLYSSKQAMHQNISRIMDLKPICFPDVSKQAVSKARQGICPSLFKELFDTTVDAFAQSSVLLKLWRGRERVFAIDGSRIQLPNSRSNFKKFSDLIDRNNPDKHCSMALASIIYDVTNDFICHGLIRPYLSSERDAAMDHARALESLAILKGAVLLFDRGYYSEALFRYFSKKGFFCVMRLKESSKLSKSCKGDTLLDLHFDGDDITSPEELPVRVLKIHLGDGTNEYLATNLFSHEYSQADFKELYFLRWSLESKYYELKDQLLLEEFNGATSVSIEQEFFINLLYSNLASLTKASADIEIEETAKPDNKYRYQANRAYIIGRLKNIFVPVLCHAGSDSLFDDLFRMACRSRSQIQPGRSSSRSNLKRGCTHHNNRKTAV